MTSLETTLVFIPGSWHKPLCYEKIIKILKGYEIRCVTVTLPSTMDDPSAGFKEDLDAARVVVEKETDQRRNVIVVAHSYGGMVGNSVIKGFAKKQGEREYDNTQDQRAVTGKVVGLILIASGFPLEGLAFMDPLMGRPPPAWRIDKESGYAVLNNSPQHLFYHDVPKEDADYYSSQITTQSLRALFTGGEYTYAGWKDVPVWYIGTTEDRGLPVAVQRMQVGMAREMGAKVEHRELQTSHSPFLSQPEETVGIMIEAITAFVGSSLRNAPAQELQRRKVSVPAFRLFQPLTWFKYGLPLAFGHFVGRGILLYGAIRRIWHR